MNRAVDGRGYVCSSPGGSAGSWPSASRRPGSTTRTGRGPPGDEWNVTRLVTLAIVGLLAVLVVSCCQANQYTRWG
jgi:hypothetical protein